MIDPILLIQLDKYVTSLKEDRDYLLELYKFEKKVNTELVNLAKDYHNENIRLNLALKEQNLDITDKRCLIDSQIDKINELKEIITNLTEKLE